MVEIASCSLSVVLALIFDDEVNGDDAFDGNVRWLHMYLRAQCIHSNAECFIFYVHGEYKTHRS